MGHGLDVVHDQGGQEEGGEGEGGRGEQEDVDGAVQALAAAAVGAVVEVGLVVEMS
jgi:hypothetical protein